MINQTTIAHYRFPLMRHVWETWGGAVALSCGDDYFDPSLTSDPRVWSIAQRMHNHYYLGRRCLFQEGFREHARSRRLLITEFNFRILSTLLVIRRRKQSGLPTVLWGHARGRSRLTGPLQRWMSRNIDGFICYTHSQREWLEANHPGPKYWVAPNAVMWRQECFALPAQAGDLTDFIFVARLVKNKKPALAVEAFARAVAGGLLPDAARLVIVGAGPERGPLENLAAHRGVDKRVSFLGHVDDIARLRDCYRTAVCSLSPGYVGLSATQSFGFGVPMLVARSEPHSPEIEACHEGQNAYFFESDSAEALALLMRDCFSRREQLLGQRAAISEHTQLNYSFDKMAETFDEVIRYFSAESAGRQAMGGAMV